MNAQPHSASKNASATPDYLAQVFAQYPVPVASGEGVWLNTTDGRRILDMYGGHAVAALGYGHPIWTRALIEQARTLCFQTNAVPLEVRTRAAQRLIRFSGLDLNSVFFVNSGAEANENALRMAFRMTQRSHVAAMEYSFHGRTAAAGAVTWGAASKWYGFPRTPFDVSFLPRRDLNAITQQITDRTAAVIIEPVQGQAGAFEHGVEYLRAVRAQCDKVGALLIFDEVQCGMGRVGAPFAAQLYGIAPDMISTAKALGSGFPCSALLMSPRVSAAVKPDSMGTTFGGGPMACAVIEAVIEAIESEHLLENVRNLSKRIRESCIVGPVTASQGEGFLIGLRTQRPAKEVHADLLARGILAGTAADPNIVRLLPPFVLQAAQVDLLRDALLDIGA